MYRAIESGVAIAPLWCRGQPDHEARLGFGEHTLE